MWEGCVKRSAWDEDGPGHVSIKATTHRRCLRSADLTGGVGDTPRYIFEQPVNRHFTGIDNFLCTLQGFEKVKGEETMAGARILIRRFVRSRCRYDQTPVARQLLQPIFCRSQITRLRLDL